MPVCALDSLAGAARKFGKIAHFAWIYGTISTPEAVVCVDGFTRIDAQKRSVPVRVHLGHTGFPAEIEIVANLAKG